MRKTILLIMLCIILAVSAAACQNSAQEDSINITNVQMTTELDSNGVPVDSVTSYSTDAEKFIITATVNNAPDDTVIIFLWKQESTILYKSDELDVSNTNEYNVYAALTNDQVWDEGDYSVEIYVDDNAEPFQTVDFTVNAN